MRKSLLLSASLLAALVLCGCGGGVDVEVVVPPPPGADFDIGARLDGHVLLDVDVYPDDEQTLQLHTGDVLELDASGPVYWELAAGTAAGVPTLSGATLVWQGVAFTQTLSTSGELVLAVSASQPLVAPVAVTLYATSLRDGTQTARIDLVVTH